MQDSHQRVSSPRSDCQMHLAFAKTSLRFMACKKPSWRLMCALCIKQDTLHKYVIICSWIKIEKVYSLCSIWQSAESSQSSAWMRQTALVSMASASSQHMPDRLLNLLPVSSKLPILHRWTRKWFAGNEIMFSASYPPDRLTQAAMLWPCFSTQTFAWSILWLSRLILKLLFCCRATDHHLPSHGSLQHHYHLHCCQWDRHQCSKVSSSPLLWRLRKSSSLQTNWQDLKKP